MGLFDGITNAVESNLGAAASGIIGGVVNSGLSQVNNLVNQTTDSLLGQAGSAVSGLVGNALSGLPGNIGGLFGNQAGSLASTSGRRNVLQAMQGRPDPLLSFNWWAQMPTISPLNGNSYPLPWEYVEEATLPYLEFDAVSNYRAGRNYHFANHASLGSLALKVYEDVHGTASQYFYQWQACVYNPDTGLFYTPNGKSGYKKSIVINVLDVAQMSVMNFTYTGCWPTRVDSLAMNSGTSDRIVLSVDLSVDELSISFGKFTSDQVPSLMNAIGASFPPDLTALPDIFPSSFVNFSF